MPSGITKLPLELLSKITHNVSEADLCHLRSVNSIFNTLATPAVFSSIIVRSYKESAEFFFTLMHTPHIVRHVQSIEYVECMSDFSSEESLDEYEVARDLKLAFSVLDRASSLKMLSLNFSVYYTGRHGTGNACSHQWTIIEALAINIKCLPRLQSLKIFSWLDLHKSISLFDKANIKQLTASLRHLCFSLPVGVNGPADSESRELFWKKVVVRHMLKPAVNLESLALKGVHNEAQSLDISRAQLDTYPRLAALSLRAIVWEGGTIGQGGIVMPPPLEDFIVRHGKTLKILKLYRCSINVKDYGRAPPLCYWADVYERLANALTELVELEVNADEIPYLSSTPPPGKFVLPWPYHRLKRLEGMERDADALEEFKAVVKKRAMENDLDFDREANGWSGWDEEREEC